MSEERQTPPGGNTPDLSEDLALKERVQDVIDSQINPAVAMHGGFITLLDVKEGIAYVEMGGGCQGCGAASVTLKHGVEMLLREEVPEIRGVLDSTDHASGTNPFYTPAVK